MDNLGEIIGCLEKQKEIFEELLAISRKKKEVIIDGKINDLDSIVKTEGNLIIEISKIDEEREKAVNALAEELGCSSKELDISYLCSKVLDKRTDYIRKLAHSIGSILKELKEINDLNSKLIEQSLEYINFSINLVADALEGQEAVYNGTSQEKAESSLSIFDTKV